MADRCTADQNTNFFHQSKKGYRIYASEWRIFKYINETGYKYKFSECQSVLYSSDVTVLLTATQGGGSSLLFIAASPNHDDDDEEDDGG
jgi:hypothetical protein